MSAKSVFPIAQYIYLPYLHNWLHYRGDRKRIVQRNWKQANNDPGIETKEKVRCEAGNINISFTMFYRLFYYIT